MLNRMIRQKSGLIQDELSDVKIDSNVDVKRSMLYRSERNR